MKKQKTYWCLFKDGKPKEFIADLNCGGARIGIYDKKKYVICWSGCDVRKVKIVEVKK